MAHLIIENEGDMEHGLDYAFKLAVTKGNCKKLRISFPSEGMMTIFVRNLFETFLTNDVSHNNGLDIGLFVPKEKGEKDYE